MSDAQSPVEVVVQLLGENMHVVKEDGSLANIQVSREWLSHEALQNVDGQVTVGLAECHDTKLDLSGKLRRRLCTMRVIRENRNSPGGSLAYLDVVSYRDLDRVDVKPVIYRTEFFLKSWVFENLGV